MTSITIHSPEHAPEPAAARSTWLVAGCTAFVLAGCATAVSNPPTGAAAPPAVAAAGPAASAAASAPFAGARPPPPVTPAPFATVTRGAERADGFLPVWTRDGSTWIEIAAALLEQPIFLASSLSGGLGERFFFPGLMGREHIVMLRRVGNNVQLVALNQHARAPAGTPLARAVRESYADSLLGVAPLAAAPHAQSKALLVDASALLGGDLGGLQTRLEQSYRMPYSLDRANSSIERVRTREGGLHLTLRQHFAVPRLPAPPVVNPAGPPPNLAALPNPPRTVPDPRSLFLGVTYTLAPLPAQPMQSRKADPRVGYFAQSYVNFGDDHQEGRRTHVIERWRLEKKDPAAAVSEPKAPIRVVLDRNIPDQWREPLRAAALEWNKAFERAGFRDALSVEQQAADADWSTLEGTRMLAVRWFAQDGPGSTAVGPSQSDPRTGEILRGAAIIDENRVRVFRARAAEVVPRFEPAAAWQPAAEFAQRYAQCSYGADAMEQAQFGFELLVERGQIDPDGPDADRYIAAALKDVTMHEIGHALGLRHNFRASTAVTLAQLRDPAFAAANGLSASVMDYNGQNLPLDGEPVTHYNMATLGAYDYWAIEYGYREFAGAEDEKQALQALLARSEHDRALAYATDEDLGNGDPLVNQRDMGDDPLAYAHRQLKLARELWQRTTTRALKPDEDLTIYRRALGRVLATLGSAVPQATKYLGGTYTARAKSSANQPLVVPVAAVQQRAALAFVTAELFSASSFRFDPKIMSRLGVDQHERSGPGRAAGVDFSLPGAVLGLQRSALDTLMSDVLAGRLADAESKVADASQLMSYAEVQTKLSAAVWSELRPRFAASGVAIDSLRRNLQREHLRRLAGGLLRPASAAAADVRAVHRHVALQLQSRLRAALDRSARDTTGASVMHLEDSLAILNEALQASLVKQGV